MAVILKYIIAGLVRFWLIHTDYWQTISNRVEIATPLNSWKRLIEGVYLYDNSINPYEGDSFHESPILLIFFHFILKQAPYIMPMFFTIVDLLTAYFLYKTSKEFVGLLEKNQEKNKDDIANESKSMLLQGSQLSEVPEYVLSVFLFNPYTILNCVGMTTTVIQNLFLSVSLWSAVTGYQLISCGCIAFATHQALYPITLIVPISILLADANKGCNKCSYIRTLLVFVLCWGFLIYISAYIMDGSYDYVYNTYGFILNVPDLKPNIGLFWYFFTEMFEHFRLLFVCAFQINALVLYVVPLTLRFRNEPMLLATVLITLSAIFRSYPCIGDVGFYLALLPMWKPLFSYLMFAYLKREFTLKHGTARLVDGKPAKLVLR
ncbi:unnamed protein product [Leptidea sinapis]|uniref:Phosphatidylinositol glycan anchor biosynthesis class U protein n=1 Tax=Leptidea sinapis TaxID=189913 RepID=A0A5E4QT66_9NEOP|nr:unnamed protein product [Leptidea sinapis]